MSIKDDMTDQEVITGIKGLQSDGCVDVEGKSSDGDWVLFSPHTIDRIFPLRHEYELELAWIQIGKGESRILVFSDYDECQGTSSLQSE